MRFGDGDGLGVGLDGPEGDSGLFSPFVDFQDSAELIADRAVLNDSAELSEELPGEGDPLIPKESVDSAEEGLFSRRRGRSLFVSSFIGDCFLAVFGTGTGLLNTSEIGAGPGGL